MYLAGIFANIGSFAGSTSPIRYLSAMWPGAGLSEGVSAGLSTGAGAGVAGGPPSGVGVESGADVGVAEASASAGGEGGASALTSLPLTAMSTEELAPLQAARMDLQRIPRGASSS